MRNLKIKIRNNLKKKLSNRQIEILLKIYIFTKRIFWPIINPYRFYKLKYSKNTMVNLGCSEKLLSNFVNVDVRVTSAVDITMDLNKPRFAKNSVKCFFSNAFFEHLFYKSHLVHLQILNNSLMESGGFICYISIPYFKNIAYYYLNKSIGTSGPIFDLYTAYRYTHGDPDRMLKEGWYLEQLHKYLFDEDYLAEILEKSGFKNYIIFEHSFPFDLNKLPVNIGFFASKSIKTEELLKNEMINFLEQFKNEYICLNSIKFLKIKFNKI